MDSPLLALALSLLFPLAGVVAIASLIDSAIRWKSAFKRLTESVETGINESLEKETDR